MRQRQRLTIRLSLGALHLEIEIVSIRVGRREAACGSKYVASRVYGGNYPPAVMSGAYLVYPQMLSGLS